MSIYQPVEPKNYPIKSGFPYYNLARWFDISYEKVLNYDRTLPQFVLKYIKAIRETEKRRSEGVYGPL